MNDTFFITMTTRGSWLHGDERGSFDSEGNFIPPSIELFEKEKSSMNHSAFAFTPPMKEVVRQAFQEVVQQKGWKIYAITVQSNHVHIALLVSHQKGEYVRNALKSKATMRLRKANLISPTYEPWTRLGNIVTVRDSKSLNSICRYIEKHQEP